MPCALQCITDWHRQNGFGSSLELPDNTLNFAKKHPLMDEAVPPQRGRPLLLKRDANFTQLAVHRVMGLDGATYEVLFIGTGDSRGQGNRDRVPWGQSAMHHVTGLDRATYKVLFIGTDGNRGQGYKDRGQGTVGTEGQDAMRCMAGLDGAIYEVLFIST
ncbi:hypothetical protein HGM15179_022122, partial [Zosterops borbonicus]